MAISAGSIPCPPFIYDQLTHRRAISEWMFRVSPFIVSASAGASNFITAASLSATSGASVIGFLPSLSLTSTTVQSAILEVKSLITTGSISAGAVIFTPANSLTAINVQAAIVELKVITDSLSAMAASLSAAVVFKVPLSASSGSTLVGFQLSATSASIRTVFSKLDDILSVRDFGAVGDGVTDDTAAIQRAINAQRGVVFFPAGSYRYSSLSCLDETILRGEGRNETLLKTSLLTGNALKVVGKSRVILENINFGPAATMTSGSVIYLENSHEVYVRDFMIEPNAFTGITIEGGASQFLTHIQNFDIGNGKGFGIKVGIASLCQDTFITNGVISTMSAGGIVLIYAGGTYISDVDIIGGGTGLSTYPGAGQFVTAGFFNVLLADTTNGDGFAMFQNGGALADLNFNNCWAASNLSAGFNFASADGVLLSGCRIINNKKDGILIQGGQNYTITGCQIGMNSMTASNNSDGVVIAANVSHFNITGNIIGGPLGRIGQLAANWQRYGILINAGTSNNYTIIGNDLTGNVTSAINDGGTGSMKYVNSNVGITGGASIVSVGFNSVNGFAGAVAGTTALSVSLSTTVTGLLYGDGTSIRTATATNVINALAYTPAASGFTGWTSPTLLGTWINTGAPYANAGYTKNDLGEVQLRGVVNNGTIGSGIFVLTAGARPAQTRIFPVVSNAALGVAIVKSTGTVSAFSGNTASFVLDGIFFPIN